MATLYLSGGGLGRSAQAWPEALHWLAAQPGPLLLASIASDDDRQARTLQQLLSAAGREATLVAHLPQEITEPTTLFLCGGDATRLKFCRTHVHQVNGALSINWKKSASCTVLTDPVTVVSNVASV